MGIRYTSVKLTCSTCGQEFTIRDKKDIASYVLKAKPTCETCVAKGILKALGGR